jgi:hypothetical protein
MSRLTNKNEIPFGCNIMILVFYLYIIIAYCVNVYQLVTCDFKEPYKGEIVRVVGLFTPTCWVTIWMDFE